MKATGKGNKGQCARTADKAMHCKTFKGREDVIALRGRRKD